jgi:hypothetical protein
VSEANREPVGGVGHRRLDVEAQPIGSLGRPSDVLQDDVDDGYQRAVGHVFEVEPGPAADEQYPVAWGR